MNAKRRMIGELNFANGEFKFHNLRSESILSYFQSSAIIYQYMLYKTYKCICLTSSGACRVMNSRLLALIKEKADLKDLLAGANTNSKKLEELFDSCSLQLLQINQDKALVEVCHACAG